MTARVRAAVADYWHGLQWMTDLACLVFAGLVVTAWLTRGPVAAAVTATAVLALLAGVVIAQVHETARAGLVAGGAVLLLGALVTAALR